MIIFFSFFLIFYSVSSLAHKLPSFGIIGITDITDKPIRIRVRSGRRMAKKLTMIEAAVMIKIRWYI